MKKTNLTRLLTTNSDIKNLFRTLPDFENEFSHGFIADKPILCPPTKGVHYATIGTAFDFWFRAYIQRINDVHIEKEVPLVLQGMIDNMHKEKQITYKEAEAMLFHLHKSWELRGDFIQGHAVNENRLLYVLFYLTSLEQYYRGAPFHAKGVKGYLHASLLNQTDLKQLTDVAKSMEPLFKMNHSLICNPNFTSTILFSRINADGDFIVDGTLYDIKTTSKSSYNKDYVHQLIGYYLLNKYELHNRYDINQLALYFARYNHVATLSVEKLENLVNMDAFYRTFAEICVDM